MTTDELRASLIKECDICLHLFTKLDEGGHDYRPSEGQRSTLELLRYLAICGSSTLTCMLVGDWKRYKEFAARVENMPADAFPAAMETQKKEIIDLLESLGDDDLRTRTGKLPSGEEQPLETAIVNSPLKYLTAYKLQLFVHAKATGSSEINTANAWMGVDWKG